MAIYYIDPLNGSDSASGLYPSAARRDYRTLTICPGDTVCFKRGCLIRAQLETVAGEPDAPVTYTSYGSGPLPVFTTATDVSNLQDWEETTKNIWRCKKDIPGEVGNFIFDDDRCEATLCWEQEDLTQQGDFWDSRFGLCENRSGAISSAQELLFYSVGNPAAYYRHIECASHAGRRLCLVSDHNVLENLCFRGSGVHAVVGNGRDVVIRGCDFRNIGGCVFEKPIRVRFGNAIEFWIHAEDILVENCSFRNIYDSCVTHQGPKNNTPPAQNFNCRNNFFDTYSMAAFEYRDAVPIDSVFEHNLCRNAGCGFGMRGETLPRNSVIWPQPMGHHIFLWRMDRPTQGGNLRITENTFDGAIAGAHIYSIICPEAESQITLDKNKYLHSGPLFCRFGGEDFTTLTDFREKTGQEPHNAKHI